MDTFSDEEMVIKEPPSEPESEADDKEFSEEFSEQEESIPKNNLRSLVPRHHSTGELDKALASKEKRKVTVSEMSTGSGSENAPSPYRRDRNLRKTKSIPASIFLETSFYKKGYLTYGEEKKVFGVWQKKCFVRLTANYFTAYKDELTDLVLKKMDIALREIQSLRLLSKGNPFGEHSFAMIMFDQSQRIFTTESKLELAEWVVALDGLISNIQSNSFNTFVEPITDKKRLLQLLFKDNYKGGIIKSSYGEEWEYRPDGTVSSITVDNCVKIVYEWDGEFFSPKKIEGNLSYGAGHWNGVWCGWYLEEWMILKITGQREKFLKYFVDQKEEEFIPENKGLSVWKKTRHFLASKSNEGEWIIEGSVPEPIAMFLQLIRYSRLGYDEKPDSEFSVPSWKKSISSDSVILQTKRVEPETLLSTNMAAAVGILAVSLGFLAFVVYKYRN